MTVLAVVALAVVGILAGPVTAAGAAPEEVHGADAVFVGPGVAIAWAVLRGASEDDTRVVMRVVPRGGPWYRMAVEAVDPFSGERHVIVPPQRLLAPVDVVTARASFAALPRREVWLFTSDGQRAVTIFYLGVPDTTPEFTSEAAVGAYLDRALTEARGSHDRP